MEETKDVDQPRPRTLNIGDTYTYLGYKLEVIQRIGDIVLAEHLKYGIEVFKVRHRKVETCPSGSVTQPGEYPPKTSEWGLWPSGHWRIDERDAAKRFFNELVRSEETPPLSPNNPRMLQVGDWYLHKGQRIDVQQRVGEIVLCGNTSHGWEIFKIRKRKADICLSGSMTPAGEYPPSTSEWGIDSGYWPYNQKTRAENYFNQLIKLQGKHR